MDRGLRGLQPYYAINSAFLRLFKIQNHDFYIFAMFTFSRTMFET